MLLVAAYAIAKWLLSAMPCPHCPEDANASWCAMQGLHVGDRFTESGNDSATRDCCSILWVANPEETDFLVSMLLKDIRASCAQPCIE